MSRLALVNSVDLALLVNDVDHILLDDSANTSTAIVEIGFTSYPTTAQADIVWTDVTTDVISPITVKQGRSSELGGTFQPGSVSFTLKNDDRKYDPRHTAGIHYGYLRPLRPVRVTVNLTGHLAFPVFVGYIQGWPQTYRHPDQASVPITALDGLSLLSLANLTDNFFVLDDVDLGQLDDDRLGNTAVAFTTELTGDRIARLLDLAGWPDADRALDDGQVFVTSDSQTGSALSTLNAVADVEFGQLYVNRDGQIVFEDRLHRLTDTRSTASQATFSDDPAETDRYVDVAYSDDHKSIINDARRTREGGTEQAATDSVSVGEFYRRVDSKTNLPAASDDQLLTLCQYLVARYAQPQQRIENLAARAVAAARLATILDLRVSDMVTVERLPQGVGTTIAADYLIEGYSLTLRLITSNTVDVSWSAYVSPADTTDYFILDTDMLDVGVLVL